MRKILSCRTLLRNAQRSVFIRKTLTNNSFFLKQTNYIEVRSSVHQVSTVCAWHRPQVIRPFEHFLQIIYKNNVLGVLGFDIA
jgi:hypothetical protein